MKLTAATARPPGAATLVATGCGTAIACVCAVGLLAIERQTGGVWSVLAVLVAALLCAAVARALARLTAVVPSGVGLLAFLSRGLGRRWALALMLPYVAIVLGLVALEARIVGAVIAHIAPVPPLAGALAFLFGTWAVARAGVRPGLRAQAAATWVLIGGFALLALAAMVQAGADGTLAARLLPAAPAPLAFVGAVGQAIFLFMGFELVTTQIELVRSPAAIGSALRRSVWVLALFYAVAALGLAAAAPATTPGAAAAALAAPQLVLVPAVAGTIGAAGIGLLCVLASFTSWNGALLTLSRLVYALATQGLLPRGLARMDSKRLVPPNALGALLGVAAVLTVAVAGPAPATVVLAAAAAIAAVVWAAALAVRQRAPFAEAARPQLRRASGFAVAALLVAFGVGALAEALVSLAPAPTNQGELARAH